MLDDDEIKKHASMATKFIKACNAYAKEAHDHHVPYHAYLWWVDQFAKDAWRLASEPKN